MICFRVGVPVVVLAAAVAVAPGGAAADAALCAKLAGSELEPGATEGVDFTRIDAEAAIPACAAAVTADPSDMASAYRYGRALGAGGRWDEARPPLERAAATLYPNAFAALGYMQINGYGLAQDRAAALASYERAREIGGPVYSGDVAWFHYTGTVVPKDLARAATLYREAAEAGLSSAAFTLAGMYLRGDGVAAHEAEAIRLYRDASDEGYAPAQTELALRYLNGDGVRRDDAEAWRLAVFAADQGHAYGAYLRGFALETGRGVAQDLSEAARWYEVSAEAGDTVGANALGRLLEEGRGIAIDLPRARALYVTAAGAGLADAQARLGRMFLTGAGGQRDFAVARQWLEKAGDAPIAQHQLGLMAWSGEGVPQDRPKAVGLIRKAADAGLAEAQLDAARILGGASGSEPFRDEAAAVDYLQKAAAQENLDAIFLLADRLFDGRGIAKDTARALELFDKASARGHAAATEVAKNARAQIAAEARLAELEKARCEIEIRLCNRGCRKQDNGSYIYNTYDGKTWFHESGRLLPASEWPTYGCPQ